MGVFANVRGSETAPVISVEGVMGVLLYGILSVRLRDPSQPCQD